MWKRMQDHTTGHLIWRQRHFKITCFLFLSDFSLWNHCRIGFYCPGWWTVLYIFKTNLLFCPCREAILNEEMCFFHVLYFESLHGSWNSDFGKIQSIYSKRTTQTIYYDHLKIFFSGFETFFFKFIYVDFHLWHTLAHDISRSEIVGAQRKHLHCLKEENSV